MRFRPVFATLVGLAVSAPLPAADIVLAVHGGAGTMPRAELSAEREAAVRADLARALRAGHAVIAQGGSSLEAVTRAVVVLEDSPYFNAGKGAVFNHDGVNELDAAIMDGATRRAGAVAGLHRIRNPVLLARAVMEQSPHVMMAGEGAEEVVLKVVPALGGDGGVIALDANGRVAMPFNTEGMYRGTIDADGKVRTAVYRDGE
jgi:isoaspartyl peptidase/L-asparaginase-like protein (Ntn-hydrolase superfamily)